MLPRRAGSAAGPPRGLRRRAPGVHLAGPGRVQLGAGLVRLAGRRPCPRGPAGLADRRGGRRQDHDDAPAVGPALGPGGELAAGPLGRARRPDRRDTRQPGRAVGIDAGRDQARRGRDPVVDAAGARRPGRSGWPAATRGTSSRAEDAPKFAAVRGDHTRIAVGGQPDGWLDYRQAPLSPAIFTPDSG